MPAVDVTTSTVIQRPREQVAAYAGAPDNVPHWYTNIQSVEWKTERPATVGSKVAFVAQFLGRRLAYTYEIVELIPDSRLVMKTTEGPFPMETSYVWESLDDGSTRMSLRNRGNPTGFSRLLAPFMSFMVRRENQKDLARLRHQLERGEL